MTPPPVWTALLPAGLSCALYSTHASCGRNLCGVEFTERMVNGQVFVHRGVTKRTKLCVDWGSFGGRPTHTPTKHQINIRSSQFSDPMPMTLSHAEKAGLLQRSNVFSLYIKPNPPSFVKFGDSHGQPYVEVLIGKGGPEGLTPENSSIWIFRKQQECLYVSGNWLCGDDLCNSSPVMSFDGHDLKLCGAELMGLVSKAKAITTQEAVETLWSSGYSLFRHPVEMQCWFSDHIAVHTVYLYRELVYRTNIIVRDENVIVLDGENGAVQSTGVASVVHGRPNPELLTSIRIENGLTRHVPFDGPTTLNVYAAAEGIQLAHLSTVPYMRAPLNGRLVALKNNFAIKMGVLSGPLIGSPTGDGCVLQCLHANVCACETVAQTPSNHKSLIVRRQNDLIFLTTMGDSLFKVFIHPKDTKLLPSLLGVWYLRETENII